MFEILFLIKPESVSRNTDFFNIDVNEAWLSNIEIETPSFCVFPLCLCKQVFLYWGFSNILYVPCGARNVETMNT